MRILAIVIGVIITVLQVGTSYIWVETDVLTEFTQFFATIYDNGIPAWSELAFSQGKSWYILSAILFALLVLASILKNFSALLYLTVAASAISLGSMWYAMYPLHIMFSGGVNV